MTDYKQTAAPDSRTSEKDKDFIKLALDRFHLAAEAESQIRKAMLEQLKFRAGDQWPDQIKNDRIMAMRPCITINQIPKFVRQVTNDARQNRPAIKIMPTADATQDTADIIAGMCRQIQAASQADVAYDTACDMQASIGLGYFRVLTDYCYEDSFDQDILIKRIKNPFTVYFDPSAQEHDYSDAEWCFIVEDVPRADFLAEYDGPLAADYQLASIGDNAMDWMGEDYIRRAEYFHVVKTRKKIYLLADKRVIDEEQKAQLDEGGIEYQVVNERETVIREVKWAKITAFEVLEENDWAGKFIPVIPVLGEDYDIDGKRVIRGMVADAMDPQRMYNYHSTAFTEALALAPKAPFVMAEGQDEGYERFWENANTKNYSRLIYKPITIGGQLAPAPQRNVAEPPVQAMALAIRQAADDLKGTTGIYDASLGARSNEQSGRAILARQKEGDVANFHYIDNLSRSIRYLGVILVDLIPKIYDAERIVRILHEDGESELVTINAKTKDKKGVEKIYDVTAGKYDVAVSTGPSFTTRRQEAAESMIQVTQAYPKMMDVAGDVLVRNMDWPGASEVADRLKKLLPPQLQDQEGADAIPPQVQAQMQQMQQMIQALTESLNKTQDVIDNRSAELLSKERIATQNNQTKIILERMQQGHEVNLEMLLRQLADIAGAKQAAAQPPEGAQEEAETPAPDATLQPPVGM